MPGAISESTKRTIIMGRLLGLCLGVMLLSAPVSAADFKTATELSNLLVYWRIVSLDSGAGPKKLEGFKLVISEDKMELHTPNGAKKTMGYISDINSSTKPKQIDLDFGGRKGFGIYELTGDTLKLIVKDPGEKRAMEFKGDAKGMLFLFKLEGK
jgi:uncharacterized protein (TIGR03067 family)